MKRLILMGGRPWLAEDQGKNFTATLFRYFSEEVNLAFCIFAQPETDWEETKRLNIEVFDKFKGNLKINYQTMTNQNFEEVSAWANIIYIPGGNTFVLLEKLKKYDDLSKAWDGKVIAGSSAGADLFCRGFTFLQDKTFGQGLGWLPMTCIPHWRDNFEGYAKEDWDWAEQESLNRHPDLPVLCIPETEFVEFSVK